MRWSARRSRATPICRPRRPAWPRRARLPASRGPTAGRRWTSRRAPRAAAKVASPTRRSSGDEATRTDYVVRGVVAYEVDLWGRYAHASDAARERLLATEFDRDALWLSLTGETARAYFALAAAIGQYEQARATLASREESLRIEKLRFDGGESDELTFRRVEAEAAQARALMREFEFAVEQRQNVLGVLLGRAPRDLAGQRILPRRAAGADGGAAAACRAARGRARATTRRPRRRSADRRGGRRRRRRTRGAAAGHQPHRAATGRRASSSATCSRTRRTSGP